MIFFLHSDEHMNLGFTRLLDAYSLLIPFVLCKAKRNMQKLDTDRPAETQQEIEPKYQLFTPSVCVNLEIFCTHDVVLLVPFLIHILVPVVNLE